MPEKPLIAIPVAAHTLQELKEKTAAIRSLPFDVLEWRMDGLDALSPELATQGLSLVKSEISTPIIATIRTSKEGGSFPYEDALYESCVTAVMAGLRPGTDAIDVEMERAPAPRLIESFHDFSRTPKKEDIVSRFLTMKARHASIGKIAVMAHSREDACTMMDAMAQVHKTAPDFPFIGISMGPCGQVTRTEGGKADSILTFASAGEASAPGQIALADMRRILDKAYR